MCRFERWVTERYPLTGTTEKVWRPCGKRGQDTAHIVRRDKCGRAYAHVNVVLRSCRECHDAFDGRAYGDVPFVRVPEALFLKAVATIVAHSKDLSYANAATPYGAYQSIPEGFRT